MKSLFAAAQATGLTTATVGKSGAAFIQDLGQGGYFLDENTVQPRSLVTELQSAGYALPFNTQFGYSGSNAVTLAATNGDPTARAGYITFNTTAYDSASGVTAVAARDSSDTTQGAPEDAANKYMLSVFTNYILPMKQPMLSLIWFRTPDNVEHGYGPGSANAIAGLRSQDQRLGELVSALKANNLYASTNLIVVSDHGHSSVSGPLSLYPLRAITPSGNGTRRHASQWRNQRHGCSCHWCGVSHGLLLLWRRSLGRFADLSGIQGIRRLGLYNLRHVRSAGKRYAHRASQG